MGVEGGGGGRGGGGGDVVVGGGGGGVFVVQFNLGHYSVFVIKYSYLIRYRKMTNYPIHSIELITFQDCKILNHMAGKITFLSLLALSCGVEIKCIILHHSYVDKKPNKQDRQTPAWSLFTVFNLYKN